MDVRELAPGLWRWTGRHPEWKEDVGCVYYEHGGDVFLIDPLLPPEDPDRFWAALDRDVARVGGAVHVLITVSWHVRSADDMVARYGARLWAHGDPLPYGVEEFDSGRQGEVVFWLPDHRALVTGEVIVVGPDGSLQLCPESWLPSGTGHPELRGALRPLLELDVERIVVSHGEPVLERGSEVLRALLA